MLVHNILDMVDKVQGCLALIPDLSCATTVPDYYAQQPHTSTRNPVTMAQFRKAD